MVYKEPKTTVVFGFSTGANAEEWCEEGSDFKGKYVGFDCTKRGDNGENFARW